MIKQITYKTAQRSDIFCIPNADIDSGRYREVFEPLWLDSRDTYHIEEYPSYGFILTLPKGVKTGLPEYHFDKPKNAVRIKEVFEACRD